MSVQAMTWVLDNERTTKGATRLVLLALANHAGKDTVDGAYECWPGIALLMAETNIPRERTVDDAINALIGAGLLERIVNGAPDSRIPGGRKPNLYRIVIDNAQSHGGAETAPPAPVDIRDARRPAGVRSATERGCGSRPSGGAETAPQTVKEPVLNRKSSVVDSASNTDDDDRITAAARLHAIDERDQYLADRAAGVIDANTGRPLPRIRNAIRWMSRSASNWHAAHAARARELLDAWPDTTAEQLVGLVQDYALPAAKPAPRPPCPDCVNGWALDDYGDVIEPPVPCPTCRPVSRRNPPEEKTA